MATIRSRQLYGDIVTPAGSVTALYTAPAGATVLRLLPPLVIEEAALDQVAAAIEQALTEAGGVRPAG